jgi:hypothetical protein
VEVRRSWWHSLREFTMAAPMLAGICLLVTARGSRSYRRVSFARESSAYRPIDPRSQPRRLGPDFRASHRTLGSSASDRREMELADIRSIDVSEQSAKVRWISAPSRSRLRQVLIP